MFVLPHLYILLAFSIRKDMPLDKCLWKWLQGVSHFLCLQLLNMNHECLLPQNTDLSCDDQTHYSTVISALSCSMSCTYVIVTRQGKIILA